MEEECPCKNCLILPLCKSKVNNGHNKSIYSALFGNCPLLQTYCNLKIKASLKGSYYIKKSLKETYRKELEKIFNADWWHFWEDML